VVDDPAAAIKAAVHICECRNFMTFVGVKDEKEDNIIEILGFFQVNDDDDDEILIDDPFTNNIRFIQCNPEN
jgi:hypothetical protein